MVNHYLKTLPEFFEAQEQGTKNFEVRSKDRDFRVGDILYLQEFEPPRTYTGKELRRKVTFVLDDPAYCREGYVILGTSSGETKVVRCRWCKHYDHGNCIVTRYTGDDHIIQMPPEGFCSYGEEAKE